MPNRKKTLIQCLTRCNQWKVIKKYFTLTFPNTDFKKNNKCAKSSEHNTRASPIVVITLHHTNKTRNEHQSENRRSQTSKRVRGAPPPQPSGQRWRVKKQPWNSFHSLYIRTTKKQAQRTWLRWRTRPAPFTTPFRPSSAEVVCCAQIQTTSSRLDPGFSRSKFRKC